MAKRAQEERRKWRPSDVRAEMNVLFPLTAKSVTGDVGHAPGRQRKAEGPDTRPGTDG